MLHCRLQLGSFELSSSSKRLERLYDVRISVRTKLKFLARSLRGSLAYDNFDRKANQRGELTRELYVESLPEGL